jgi:hypothetical protein
MYYKEQEVYIEDIQVSSHMYNVTTICPLQHSHQNWCGLHDTN